MTMEGQGGSTAERILASSSTMSKSVSLCHKAREFLDFKEGCGHTVSVNEHKRELHEPKLYKEATSRHLPRRISKTTTGEKSLCHCHSNRCGHVGQGPCDLVSHSEWERQLQVKQWDKTIYWDPGSLEAKTKTQHDQRKARHGTQAPPGQKPGDTGPTSTPTQGDPRSNGLALARAQYT